MSATSFRVYDPPRQLEAGLRALIDCVSSFQQARKKGNIEFDDDVVAEGLRVLSVLIERASAVSEEAREAMCQHWIEDAPKRANDLLTEVMNRRSRKLNRDDIAMFLQKPEGPVFSYERGTVKA